MTNCPTNRNIYILFERMYFKRKREIERGEKGILRRERGDRKIEKRGKGDRKRENGR